MAAKEIVNSSTIDVEPVVNRWLMDYYFSLALEFFQKEQYADFLGIRHVLDSVLVRPLEVTDSTQIKIRVLQFLSRINEGESLDVSFESDQISPLESALILLEHINKEFIIPQQDFEKICTSLKELIVVIFIKNDEFDKAEKVVNKHFVKAMVGKKAVFMGLIRKKIKVHEVIEQVNFRQFKEEMLAFCKRICPFSVPFLHKAAKMCIEKRLSEPDYKAADQDEEDDLGPSCSQQINTKFVLCKQITIPISRLGAAYTDLAAGSDAKSFAQLDKEVKREEQAKASLSLHLPHTLTKGRNQDSEKDVSFQRDSGSPMEASPADQPPQMNADPQTQAGSLTKTSSVPRKRRHYTVAKLVVEPDSQGSSQYTAASQEMESEVRTEEPPQAVVTLNKKDLQNPITDAEVFIPTRTYPRRHNRSCNRNSSMSNQSSLDGEEESPSSCKTPGKKLCKQPRNDLLGKKSSVSTPARLAGCKTRAPFQTQVTERGNSTRSKDLSSDSEEESQESPSPFKTPVQKPCKQLSTNPHNKDPGNADEVCTTDSSLDSSPNLFPLHPDPQTCSTPHKDFAQGKGHTLKWKQLFKNAQESKETWSDEESYVPSIKNSRFHNESTISNSGHRKRMWTESETQKLKEGVKKFGEGNWSKIKAYYSFKDRTNVNLKDRWRTMKKLNIV